MPMQLLDVGGGFQDNTKTFLRMATTIRRAIADAGFPPEVRLIGEPGRFFAESSYSLVCQVISLRDDFESNISHGQRTKMIYQNDGVFQHFMNRIVEGSQFRPTLLQISNRDDNRRLISDNTYTIWGPTCDSTDCIADAVKLPYKIEVGDHLLYRSMGGKHVHSARAALSSVTDVGRRYSSLYTNDSYIFQRLRCFLENLLSKSRRNLTIPSAWSKQRCGTTINRRLTRRRQAGYQKH